MNTEFWIIAIVLLSLAFLFLVPPLWRKKKHADHLVERDNLAIARQKLADLKKALVGGEISEAPFELQRQELELTLANDLSTQAENESVHTLQGQWMTYVLVVFLPLAAVSLYLALGHPEALNQSAALQQTSKKQSPHKQAVNSVETMLAGLEARLQQQPDDVQGWLLLGKSYKHLQHMDKARNAIMTAYQLNPDNPQVMLQYADVLLSENDGQYTDKSRSLVTDALQLAPNDTMALWLAGMMKAQDNEPTAALAYFRQVETIIPQDSESYRKLKMMMAQLSPAKRSAPSMEVQSTAMRQQWIQQGREFKAQKQYQQAVDAFSKVDVLNSNQADDMLMYADASLMLHQGQFSETTRQLIFKALTLAPSHTTGLWLAGKAKVQEGHYQQALTYLQRAKDGLQPGSESMQVMERYIQNTRLRAATEPVEPQAAIAKPRPSSPQQAATAEGIHVKVQLDGSLRNKVQPHHTVFIYARAVSGPQMPLAIVRKQVRDLPLQVQLTDAQAMTPMMKLSNFSEVVVMARVSASSNAIRQAGDLLGEVSPATVNSADWVTVNINQQIN